MYLKPSKNPKEFLVGKTSSTDDRIILLQMWKKGLLDDPINTQMEFIPYKEPDNEHNKYPHWHIIIRIKEKNAFLETVVVNGERNEWTENEHERYNNLVDFLSCHYGGQQVSLFLNDVELALQGLQYALSEEEEEITER